MPLSGFFAHNDGGFSCFDASIRPFESSEVVQLSTFLPIKNANRGPGFS